MHIVYHYVYRSYIYIHIQICIFYVHIKLYYIGKNTHPGVDMGIPYYVDNSILCLLQDDYFHT